ncbi:hypothetical protein GCM10023153_21350 [Ornithinibacter aureus]|uniref:Uncharacterized protein n=1 Tax=Ornithinibacter aureus TaxID=622664 RepID=A0ABP8JX25_9MICO
MRRGEVADTRPHVEVDADGGDAVPHAQRPADPLTLTAAEVEQSALGREQPIEQPGHGRVRQGSHDGVVGVGEVADPMALHGLTVRDRDACVQPRSGHIALP